MSRTCATAQTALGHKLAIINQKIEQYAQQLVEVDGDIERVERELSGVGAVETISGRLAAQDINTPKCWIINGCERSGLVLR